MPESIATSGGTSESDSSTSTKRTRASWIQIIFNIAFYSICTSLLVGLAIWQGVVSRHSVCDNLGDGNSDMFGLGVRLATYCQLFLICMTLFKGDAQLARSLATVNVWFLIAFTSALFAMLRKPEVEALEVYIVILLGNGLTMLTLVPPFPMSWSYNHSTRAQSLTKMILLAFWRSGTTYFWWRLLPQKLPYPLAAGDCKQYGYFVVRMTIADGTAFHTLHRILDTIGWIVWYKVHFHDNMFALFVTIRFIFWRLDDVNVRAPGSPDTQPSNSAPSESQWPGLPSKWYILIDCIFSFPMGDLTGVVYGRSWLPPDYEDGPLKKGDPNPLPLDHIHVVDRRFYNYLVRKYSPAEFDHKPLLLQAPRRLLYPRMHGITYFIRVWSRFWKYGEEVRDQIKESLWIAKRDGKLHGCAWFFFAIWFIVIPVEFTIKVNKIPGVDEIFNEGQLLALVASVGAVFQAIMAFISSGRRDKYGIPLYDPGYTWNDKPVATPDPNVNSETEKEDPTVIVAKAGVEHDIEMGQSKL